MISVAQPKSNILLVNEKTLSFDQAVHTVIKLDDRVIIHLKTDGFLRGDPMVGRNVLCFDKNGEMLWRIEDTGMTIGEGEDNVPQSFLSLSLKDDGKIRVGNPDAFFFVNPENGMLYDGEPKYY